MSFVFDRISSRQSLLCSNNNKCEYIFVIMQKWFCFSKNTCEVNLRQSHFFFMHFLCCDINARRVKQKTLIIRIHRLRLDIEKPIKNLFWSDQHADITPPPDKSWFKQRWIEFLIHSTDTIKCVWISNCSSRFIHASAIKLWTNSEVSTFFPDRSCRKLKTNWKFSQIKHFLLFLSQSLSSVPPVHPCYVVCVRGELFSSSALARVLPEPQARKIQSFAEIMEIMSHVYVAWLATRWNRVKLSFCCERRKSDISKRVFHRAFVLELFNELSYFEWTASYVNRYSSFVESVHTAEL